MKTKRHKQLVIDGASLTPEKIDAFVQDGTMTVTVSADALKRVRDANAFLNSHLASARQRKLALLRRATEAPKPRRPTRPTLASKERRLKAKSARSGVKRLRGGLSAEE